MENSSPLSQVERQHQTLDELDHRLNTSIQHRMARMIDKLDSTEHRLSNCSLQASLKKGFAYLKDENGKILNQASSLTKNSKVSANFSDGSRVLRVED